MKLQTQFTVPKKELRDNNFSRKVFFSENPIKVKCIDYPNQKDCLVCCD